MNIYSPERTKPSICALFPTHNEGRNTKNSVESVRSANANEKTKYTKSAKWKQIISLRGIWVEKPLSKIAKCSVYTIIAKNPENNLKMPNLGYFSFLQKIIFSLQ